MTNQNAAELDAFGRTKRSLAQAGMVGRNELGGFVVRHLKTGVEFRLGYNHIVGGIDRVTLWLRRETLVGKVVKFSHQPSGAKEAPRFPEVHRLPRGMGHVSLAAPVQSACQRPNRASNGLKIWRGLACGWCATNDAELLAGRRMSERTSLRPTTHDMPMQRTA